jgi:hypothetical protein
MKPSPNPAARGGALERHYTPRELAETWQLHPETIRRMFKDESGVLKIVGHRRGKREKITIRIPLSVAERVHVAKSR